MKKKLSITVVGIGLMGRQHLNAINKSKKARLHSIVDRNGKSLEYAKKFKVPYYKSTLELLKNSKPDAAIVATPNQFHDKDSLIFLNLKIPVLLEKPISDNIDKAKKIVSASKKNKTHLLVGYHRRHNSIISQVKKKINTGKLGRIVVANIMCWFYKNKNWYKKKWRIKKGGGPLAINLVHDIDLICYLLGPVDFVQASTSNKIRNYEVEDTAIVNFGFKSGAFCTLNLSDTVVGPWSYELTSGENPVYPVTNQSAYFIGGTKSSIQFPNLKHWFNKGERSWWNKIYNKNIKVKNSRITLINQINHFCEVVQGKSKPIVSGEDGLQSLKIFNAIQKSSKSGKKIYLK